MRTRLPDHVSFHAHGELPTTFDEELRPLRKQGMKFALCSAGIQQWAGVVPAGGNDMSECTLDPLQECTDALKVAIAAKRPGLAIHWAWDVYQALRCVAKALQIHLSVTKASTQLLSGAQGGENDCSPTQERRVCALRRQALDCLELAQSLQNEVRNLLEASFSGRRSISEKAACAPQNLEGIRLRSEELIVAVTSYILNETHVVLDAVTTDIGVGD